MNHLFRRTVRIEQHEVGVRINHSQMDEQRAVEELLPLVAVLFDAGLKVLSIVQSRYGACQANGVFCKLHPPLSQTNRHRRRRHRVPDSYTGKAKDFGKCPHNDQTFVIYRVFKKGGVKRPNGASDLNRDRGVSPAEAISPPFQHISAADARNGR